MRGGAASNLKRQTQEFYRAVHIGRLPQVDARPATLRKDVMAVCFSGRHQFFADFFRKRNIDKMIAMHMSDLSSAQTIFHPAKAMRTSEDAGKRTHRGSNFLRGPWN
jgi:hypothetical protein